MSAGASVGPSFAAEDRARLLLIDQFHPRVLSIEKDQSGPDLLDLPRLSLPPRSGGLYCKPVDVDKDRVTDPKHERRPDTGERRRARDPHDGEASQDEVSGASGGTGSVRRADDAGPQQVPDHRVERLASKDHPQPLPRQEGEGRASPGPLDSLLGPSKERPPGKWNWHLSDKPSWKLLAERFGPPGPWLFSERPADDGGHDHGEQQPAQEGLKHEHRRATGGRRRAQDAQEAERSSHGIPPDEASQQDDPTAGAELPLLPTNGGLASKPRQRITRGRVRQKAQSGPDHPLEDCDGRPPSSSPRPRESIAASKDRGLVVRISVVIVVLLIVGRIISNHLDRPAAAPPEAQAHMVTVTMPLPNRWACTAISGTYLLTLSAVAKNTIWHECRYQETVAESKLTPAQVCTQSGGMWVDYSTDGNGRSPSRPSGWSFYDPDAPGTAPQPMSSCRCRSFRLHPEALTPRSADDVCELVRGCALRARYRRRRQLTSFPGNAGPSCAARLVHGDVLLPPQASGRDTPGC